ncbi:hypothetical protein SAMN05421676_11577 [Salinibacillus kushneri]|uniref:Uncharacterized protein n=1 Tax=Salinibacillus kushneri TaxID=237682 RepID=A0A1I0J2T2_9BACI|nr:hypothetical protein [Salinibacillus kushneri]SEU03991.1 hypothetical protein SAMN05421676_11577 [Salinibacillus kushneri]
MNKFLHVGDVLEGLFQLVEEVKKDKHLNRCYEEIKEYYYSLEKDDSEYTRICVEQIEDTIEAMDRILFSVDMITKEEPHLLG